MDSGLVILGASGHGRAVADAAAASGVWGRIAFLDDNAAREHPVEAPLLGGCEAGVALEAGYRHFVVGMGNARARLCLLSEFEEQGVIPAVVLHPTAWVSPTASLGPGTVVLPQAAVVAGARLGRGCIVNTGASVDHDALLGDGVHVAPGARVGGGAVLGGSVWLGMGACVLQNRQVGSGAMVGAGAVVNRDLPPHCRAMGVPARCVPERDDHDAQ